MDKLSQLVPSVLRKRGLQEQATASYALFLASEWLVEQLELSQDASKAVSLSGQILTIEAPSSSVALQISERSEDLLHYLNRFEGISIDFITVKQQKAV